MKIFKKFLNRIRIKRLLKEGFVVIDQFGNQYEGMGITPHPEAEIVKFYKKSEVE